MDDTRTMEVPKAKMPGWAVVLIVITLILSLVAIAVSFSSRATIGSGDVVTEDRSVSDFDKVLISGSGDLIIEQGEEEGLTIEAEDNIIDKISSEVVDGELQLKSRGFFFFFWPTTSITYHLKVDDLSRVGIMGSGSVTSAELRSDRLELVISGSGEMNMNVFAEELIAEINGSGSFELTGEAKKNDVAINGSGDYLADELSVNEAAVRITGSGDARVNVVDQLTVDISGSGDVTYKGDAQVDSSISGSGSVDRVK